MNKRENFINFLLLLIFFQKQFEIGNEKLNNSNETIFHWSLVRYKCYYIQ